MARFIGRIGDTNFRVDADNEDDVRAILAGGGRIGAITGLRALSGSDQTPTGFINLTPPSDSFQESLRIGRQRLIASAGAPPDQPPPPPPGGTGPFNPNIGTGAPFDGTGNTGIGSTSLENEAGGRRAAFQDVLRSFGIESGVGGSAAGRNILNENLEPLGFAAQVQDAFGQGGPLLGEERFAGSLGRLGGRNDISSSIRGAFNTLRGGVTPEQFNTFDPLQQEALERLLGSEAAAPGAPGEASRFAGTANSILDLALRAGGFNKSAARNFQRGGGAADLLAEFARSRPSNTGGLGQGGGSNFAQFVAERFDPGNQQNLFNPA